MSDDPVFMKMLKELADEIRALRLEVLTLKNQSTKSKFLSMTEACDYLHISRVTMMKRIESGEISFANKNGGKYLFPEDKLKAYASGMI